MFRRTAKNFRRINRRAGSPVNPQKDKEISNERQRTKHKRPKLLHTTIAKALAEDDALPANAKTYGMREYPDWRHQADDIEAELTSRGETFTPIAW
jgi:hypothetical protein